MGGGALFALVLVLVGLAELSVLLLARSGVSCDGGCWAAWAQFVVIGFTAAVGWITITATRARWRAEDKSDEHAAAWILLRPLSRMEVLASELVAALGKEDAESNLLKAKHEVRKSFPWQIDQVMRDLEGQRPTAFGVVARVGEKFGGDLSPRVREAVFKAVHWSAAADEAIANLAISSTSQRAKRKQRALFILGKAEDVARDAREIVEAVSGYKEPAPAE